MPAYIAPAERPKPAPITRVVAAIMGNALEFYDFTVYAAFAAVIDEVAAEEVWVTHGREEALVHYATKQGYRARALAIAGFEEDE